MALPPRRVRSDPTPCVVAIQFLLASAAVVVAIMAASSTAPGTSDVGTGTTVDLAWWCVVVLIPVQILVAVVPFLVPWTTPAVLCAAVLVMVWPAVELDRAPRDPDHFLLTLSLSVHLVSYVVSATLVWWSGCYR